MLHVDPLAVRIARRFLAELDLRWRLAIEYQRRSQGLVPVDDDEENDAPDATHCRSAKRPGCIMARQTFGYNSPPRAPARAYLQAGCLGPARRG